MTHLLISAGHKSSGKTTISTGLCAAYRQRGLAVQPFKKGPDYIDPLWLGSAAGRACHNLDFQVMSRSEIEAVFAQRMQSADLGIIEGNKGLYDGLDLDGSNSNAALAHLLSVPVVLVVDARGMTRGIAPLILGYQSFEPGIHIGAVILNLVGGYRHEEKLRRVIEHYTDVPVLGAVHQSKDIEIVERHLGLMPSNETDTRDEIIERIGSTVAGQVDLDGLLGLAKEAPAIATPPTEIQRALVKPDLRIGIAQDAAFGFYYAGDLEAFTKAGAELVPFDTLVDPALPDIDGLFIGGGFPEVHMEVLEKNQKLRHAIRDFIEAGGPAYAECGGLMYLTRRLSWKGKTFNMVGAVPADAVMHERPQGRGYVRLSETGRFPWAKCSTETGEIAAHEFHYSALENLGDEVTFAYEVLRGTGIDGKNDGIIYKNLLANYTHMRDTSRHHWVQRFVSHVRACKRNGD